MSYFSQAATVTWQWICWCGATLFLVSGFLLVSPVLAVWLARDFIPKRKPRPLKTSSQPIRREPHLRRDGSNVFWEMPGGEIIPVEPLRAALIGQEVAEVIGGAYCYEMTRLRGDTEGAQPRL